MFHKIPLWHPAWSRPTTEMHIQKMVPEFDLINENHLIILIAESWIWQKFTALVINLMSLADFKYQWFRIIFLWEYICSVWRNLICTSNWDVKHCLKLKTDFLFGNNFRGPEFRVKQWDFEFDCLLDSVI